MKLVNTWLSTNLPNFLAIFQLFWGGERNLSFEWPICRAIFPRTRPASAESENWGAQVAAPPPPHGSAALTSGESRPRNRRRSSFFFHFGISFVWKFVDRIDELSICPNDELIKMIFQFLINWKKLKKNLSFFKTNFREFFVCFPILKNK